MPESAVTVCRAAWAALVPEPQAHVVHGGPGRPNVRVVDGRIAFLDWDEFRVDHAWFDLADLPVDVLDNPQTIVARRAADAWEAANGWRREPPYARRRLGQLESRP